MIRVMANCKAVGPDGLPVELLKVLVDERDSDNLASFYETIVAVWRRGRVPQQRKDATIKVLHKKIGWSVVTIVASPLWRTLAKYSSKSSRAASVTTANGNQQVSPGVVQQPQHRQQQHAH